MRPTKEMIYAEVASNYFAVTGRTPSEDGLFMYDDPSVQEMSDFFKEVFKQPPEKTIAMFKEKGIKVTWDWNELERAAHDESFTVAKVMNADVLQLMKDLIARAQSEGLSFKEWSEKVEQELALAGFAPKQQSTDPTTGKVVEVDLSAPSRLKTIFETNMQSSYMNSRWDQMQKSASHRPYMQYIPIVDGRTTATCSNLVNVVVEMGDAGVRIPPLHYNCRTRIRSLAQRDLDRKNLTVQSAEVLQQQPPGEGFNSPPGNQWTPDLSKYDADIQSKLKKELKK